MLGESLRNKKGQLLVEAIISISILIVGLLGIFVVISQSLGLYRIAYEQYIASNLAAEGIEVVKNMIDSNSIDGTVPWNQGLATDGDYGVQYDSRALDGTITNKNILYNENTGLYNYDTGTPTNFKRVITTKNISVDEIQVNSVVSWKSRGGFDYVVNLEDRFFNWKP